MQGRQGFDFSVHRRSLSRMLAPVRRTSRGQLGNELLQVLAGSHTEVSFPNYDYVVQVANIYGNPARLQGIRAAYTLS